MVSICPLMMEVQAVRIGGRPSLQRGVPLTSQRHCPRGGEPSLTQRATSTPFTQSQHTSVRFSANKGPHPCSLALTLTRRHLVRTSSGPRCPRSPSSMQMLFAWFVSTDPSTARVTQPSRSSSLKVSAHAFESLSCQMFIASVRVFLLS